MGGSPLEEGTKSFTVCAAIRKRKGLKEQIPPLENFVDKL
jgi:elongation factor 2